MVFCRVSRSSGESIRTNDEGGGLGIVALDYALDGVVRKRGMVGRERGSGEELSEGVDMIW